MLLGDETRAYWIIEGPIGGADDTLVFRADGTATNVRRADKLRTVTAAATDDEYV